MKRTLLTFTTLLLASGLALAAPPCMKSMGGPGCGQGKHGRMMSYDEDGDGKISKQEHMKRVEARFNRYDKNGDGTITKDEFAVRPNKRFKAMDADGDGYVTREERQEMRMKMKAKRQEMRQQRQKMSQEMMDKPLTPKKKAEEKAPAE
jgi:Ca2+-binding EF-hand superfamily protein